MVPRRRRAPRRRDLHRHARPHARAPTMRGHSSDWSHLEKQMIRKLKTGEFRLYSRKTNPKTGKRRNLGTFGNREAAEKHERAVQYFKRH